MFAFHIERFEDNEGTIAVADNLLSSGKSQHIDVRWHITRGMDRTKVIIVIHVELEWQHADILRNALPISLFKRHRNELINLRDGEWLRACGKITNDFLKFALGA